MTELELTARYLADPAEYARVRLGMKLHPTQAAVLRALFQPKSRVVFGCGNEVGKTRRVVVEPERKTCLDNSRKTFLCGIQKSGFVGSNAITRCLMMINQRRTEDRRLNTTGIPRFICSDHR